MNDLFPLSPGPLLPGLLHGGGGLGDGHGAGEAGRLGHHEVVGSEKAVIAVHVGHAG